MPQSLKDPPLQGILLWACPVASGLLACSVFPSAHILGTHVGRTRATVTFFKKRMDSFFWIMI